MASTNRGETSLRWKFCLKYCGRWHWRHPFKLLWEPRQKLVWNHKLSGKGRHFAHKRPNQPESQLEAVFKISFSRHVMAVSHCCNISFTWNGWHPDLTISSAKQNRLWIESREGLDSRIFWWDKPGWPTRTYSGEYSEETGVAQGGTQESMDHPQPAVLASANQGTSYSMQLSSLFRLMIITIITIITISFGKFGL